MPQMGESIFEGTITKWLKKVGDSVQRDEPLFEISTDKVDAEIPSPASGTLSEIKVEAGNTVQINTVVAVIGGAAAKASRSGGNSSGTGSRASASRDSSSGPRSSTTRRGSVTRRAPALLAAGAQDCEGASGRSATGPGTGSTGRITKEDILQYVEKGGAAKAPAAAPAAAQPAPAATPKPAAPPAPAAAGPQPGELVPLTRMRSIIAQRMIDSKRTSAHVHTVFKVDMTRIVKIREKEKTKYEQRNGVKLTYMPFITRAVVATLRKMPIVNASLEGDAIRYHQNVNVGIAVALDWGFIVPVVKQAEEKSFLGLARAIADLAERARSKKLKPDEVGIRHHHDYESGDLRRAVRHADHQSAGIGDPGRGRPLQGADRAHGQGWQ